MSAAGSEGRPGPADSTRTYVLVWAALLALLGATIAVARLRVASFGVVINLAIAAAKAALVLLVFMNLRGESRFLKVMLGVTVGTLTLIIMLTFSDVWIRG